MKRICQNCEIVRIDTDDKGSYYIIDEDTREKHQPEPKIVCKSCYEEMEIDG